ncbi:MAG: hypothetical protein AAF501_19595, partial [Pseudomonadota bacterium]
EKTNNQDRPEKHAAPIFACAVIETEFISPVFQDDRPSLHNASTHLMPTIASNYRSVPENE